MSMTDRLEFLVLISCYPLPHIKNAAACVRFEITEKTGICKSTNQLLETTTLYVLSLLYWWCQQHLSNCNMFLPYPLAFYSLLYTIMHIMFIYSGLKVRESTIYSLPLVTNDRGFGSQWIQNCVEEFRFKMEQIFPLYSFLNKSHNEGSLMLTWI